MNSSKRCDLAIVGYINKIEYLNIENFMFLFNANKLEVYKK